MLNVSKREKNYSTYYIDNKSNEYFPFEVLMINSPKKKTIYQYPNSINLHWTIDQFNTVFNYIGDENDLVRQPFLENKETQVNLTNENPRNNNIEWI